MKIKNFLHICLLLALTVSIASCQLPHTRELVKTIDPHAPFIDENIEALTDRAETTVDRSATVAGNAGNLPVRFWQRFKRALKGRSEVNPYKRSPEYYRKDFQEDVLRDTNKHILQPEYVRGLQYAKAYRAPFITEEGAAGSEMVETSHLKNSETAQRYFQLQQSLEKELLEAESLYEKCQYNEALEMIEHVLDLDPSSQDARMLFEKTIKAREADRIKQEADIKEKISRNEKIAQYLAEAKRYLAKGDSDEALRIAKKALSLDPLHDRANEFVDTVELTQFEQGLIREGYSGSEILERMIHEHLRLYKQYTLEQLTDLATKELQKVSILEAHKEKLASLSE